MVCAMCIISMNSELAELANAGGLEIAETFYSDGENKRLSLYQIWKKVKGI